MGNDWNPDRLKYGEGPRHEPDVNTGAPPRTSVPAWPLLKSAQQVERHDYEMGEALKPMHTDPMCSVCGEPRSAAQHK